MPSAIASLHADFQRAVKHGNVARAEAAARQLGRLPLGDALKLVQLYAEKEPAKFERAALRWHARYVSEAPAVTLPKAQLALAALGARGDAARTLLIELVAERVAVRDGAPGDRSRRGQAAS